MTSGYSMADELETRLQSHAKAFEGMLALIPADYYYGKDNSVRHTSAGQDSLDMLTHVYRINGREENKLRRRSERQRRPS